MEDDREIRSDEDVEAHSNRNRGLNRAEEDVEAHSNRNRGLNRAEDDDVEAHMQLGNVKNSTKL